MKGKLRILFLSADPRNVKYRPLLKKEVRLISAALQQGRYQKKIEFFPQWCVTPQEVQEALDEYKPHILHFSGHGDKDAGIMLEDEDGKACMVTDKALTSLIKSFKGNIHLVFLNSCHSKNQVKAFKRLIDYTIGMNTSVSDEVAIRFASSFYKWLSGGLSVNDAFNRSKGLLELLNDPDFQIPELFIRPGVDSSQPFIAQLLSKGQETKQARASSSGKKASGKHRDAPNLRAGHNVSVGRDLKESTIIFGDNNRINKRSNR
jgi:hypothetical protein